MWWNRRIVTFNIGTPDEITWDIYIGFEEKMPSFQYIAEAHCLTRTQPCWVLNGNATQIDALTQMNNHVVNYVKLLPEQTFEVICYPEEEGETNAQIDLAVTITNKTWDIQVTAGIGNSQNGTGKNYAETVLNCWNAIMSY